MSTVDPTVDGVIDDAEASITADEPVASPMPWSWHLQRALAIVLVVAMPVWLLSWLVVPDFGALTIVDLRARWSHPAWRGADLVVVVAGLVHAALHVRPLLERRVESDTTRLVLEAAVWTVTAGLIAGALNVILTLGV